MAGLIHLTLVGGASATPIVALDASPGSPGIQAEGTAEVGDVLTVDVVLFGLSGGESVGGFEIDIGFDPAVLLALSVSGGSFLTPPTFVVQEEVGFAQIQFTEVSLVPIGATGDGVLATLSFEAIGVGQALLDISAALAAPFGVPLPAAAVEGATIRVGSAPIPEPRGAALFAVGAGLVARHLRRGSRR